MKRTDNQEESQWLSVLCPIIQYVCQDLQKQIVIAKRDYMKWQVKYASPSKVTRKKIEQLRQKIHVNNGIRCAISTVLMPWNMA